MTVSPKKSDQWQGSEQYHVLYRGATWYRVELYVVSHPLSVPLFVRRHKTTAEMVLRACVIALAAASLASGFVPTTRRLERYSAPMHAAAKPALKEKPMVRVTSIFAERRGTKPRGNEAEPFSHSRPRFVRVNAAPFRQRRGDDRQTGLVAQVSLAADSR